MLGPSLRLRKKLEYPPWEIYPSNKYISVVLLLTNHETPYNLKILC